MFRKKLYIHIGHAKTGTTALQKFLMDNSKELYQKYSILYTNYKPEWFNHTTLFIDVLYKALIDNGIESLGSCFGHREPPEKFFQEIERTSHMVDTIIISSEFFSATGLNGALNAYGVNESIDFNLDLQIKKDIIKTLYEITKKYDVRIVYYMRRQDVLLESIYNQRMKACNLDMNFEDFYNYIIKSGSLDIYAMLGNWSKHFGQDKIIIRCYDKIKESGIEHDFLENVLGQTCESLNIEKSNQNDRLARDIIEYRLRYLMDMDKYNPEIFETIQHLYEWDDDKTAYAFLSEEKRHELLEYYKESNWKVVEEYLNGDDCLSLNSDASNKLYPGLSNEKEKRITQEILSFWFEKYRSNQ